MTSKFQGPRINFKTPAVCKKSPPGPNVSITTPPNLSAFYNFDGTASDGTPLAVSQPLDLLLTSPAEPIYQLTTTIDGDRWEFEWGTFDGGTTWFFTATRQELSAGATVRTFNFNVTIRYREPFNSGIFQIPVITGTGSAQARVLL